MRRLQQAVQGFFKRGDALRFAFTFVKRSTVFADEAALLFGGFPQHLIGLAVHEFLVEIGHHHVAVQLARDFDEVSAVVSHHVFQRDFLVVQAA